MPLLQPISGSSLFQSQNLYDLFDHGQNSWGKERFMDLGALWFGIGFETGGEIVAGVNYHQGALYSHGDLIKAPKRTRYCSIEQSSATVGLGLGGSGGFTFLIGVNGGDPQVFSQPADWSGDFSLDVGIGGLAKYLRTVPEMIELAKLAKQLSKSQRIAADAFLMYEKNRYLLKDVSEGIIKNSGGMLDALNNKTGLISLPMPLANYGLRFSVKLKYESTTVTNWGTFDFTA